MSVNYAASLSPYDNKGKCGQAEVFEDEGSVREKCRELAKYIKDSRHVVVHTGAGISTSAGIPDFRGPKGVWTLEKRGESVSANVTFERAQPTYTHRALLKLHQAGHVHYIVSQNVDGLHLRSGFPRCALSVLHGDMFIEKCEKCSVEKVLDSPVKTIGKKRNGNVCQAKKTRGVCRGHMRDTVLDWEDDLPEPDFENATLNSKKADLSICLGTTLQIVPAGTLPLQALKQPNGKLVICNLQPTKHDKKATLIIHARVDDIMSHVMEFLGLAIDADGGSGCGAGAMLKAEPCQTTLEATPAEATAAHLDSPRTATVTAGGTTAGSGGASSAVGSASTCAQPGTDADTSHKFEPHDNASTANRHNDPS
ncbi:NAD-dependent protein deacetylase Sirt6-like [Sycon ciliatum]|uniref:NAD-dependent protein deacetylase Sirt6-like n=1 Tax=Sycon ciliatum TaxID=27933 RepID=UPI0031F612A5|eukprot:scpid34155/ scgid6944/ NAD-dependent protein deacetylase sirtuin-6; Regulatory protein SIR2 homolog 6; SIR2-like protein 6